MHVFITTFSGNLRRVSPWARARFARAAGQRPRPLGQGLGLGPSQAPGFGESSSGTQGCSSWAQLASSWALPCLWVPSSKSLTHLASSGLSWLAQLVGPAGYVGAHLQNRLPSSWAQLAGLARRPSLWAQPSVYVSNSKTGDPARRSSSWAQLVGAGACGLHQVRNRWLSSWAQLVGPV